MHIDFITIHTDPKARFDISFEFNHQVKKRLNKVFENISLDNYHELVLSVSSKSNNNELSIIDTYDLKRKKIKSIAAIIPFKDTEIIDVWDVEGVIDVNLRLVKEKLRAYNPNKYLDHLFKLTNNILVQYNFDFEEKEMLLLESLFNELKEEITESPNLYRPKSQAELLLEDLYYYKNKKSPNSYELEELSFYKDSWCTFLDQVSFDEKGNIIAP